LKARVDSTTTEEKEVLAMQNILVEYLEDSLATGFERCGAIQCKNGKYSCRKE